MTKYFNRRLNNGRQREFVLALLTAPVVLAAFVVSWIVDVETIQLAAISVALAVIGLYLYVFLPYRDVKHIYVNNQTTRMVDMILMFSLAVLSISTMKLTGEGIIPVIVLAIAVVMAVRIIHGTINPVRILTMIILFGVIVRAGLFFSAPVYGQDLFHQGIPGYIISTGELIPSSLHYYHSYPLSHILIATGGLLTGLPAGPTAGLAMFLFISLVQTLAFVGIYLFCIRLRCNRRHALLVVLVTIMSAGPLIRGSQLFAQTYAGAIFILLIPLLVRLRDSRLNIILFIYLIAAFGGHHSMVISLSGTIIGLWVSQQVISLLPLPTLNTNLWKKPKSYGLAAVFCLIGYVYYMIIIGQFRGYFSRIRTILNLNRGTAQSAVSQSTLVGSPPTVEILGREFPAILSWAAPLLVLAIISGIAGLITLARIINMRHPLLPVQYIFASITAVVGYGVAYLIGGRAAGVRLLPEITVFAAALFSIISVAFLRRNGEVIVYVLAGVIVLSGVFTPAVSIPDRSADDFKPTADYDDIDAGKWASSHADQFVTDEYLTQVLYWEQVASGDSSPPHKAIIGLRQSSPRSVRNYLNPERTDLLVHREYFTRYYDVQRPALANRAYDNGDITVHEIH